MDASQIAPNLWVGGWHAARDHRADFDVVINVAVDAPHNGDFHFHLVDGPGNEQSEFDAAVECVSEHLRANKRVLVHCVAGRSRSLTVAAIAHSRHAGKVFEDVLAEFRAIRAAVVSFDDAPHLPHPAVVALARSMS